MISSDSHIDLLRRTPLDRDARAAALACACRLCDDSLRSRLVADLIDCVTAPQAFLERFTQITHVIGKRLGAKVQPPSDIAYASVVGVWDLLTPEMRQVLLAAAKDNLLRGAESARVSADPEARRACVPALADIGSVKALAGLVPLLTDPDVTVAGAADRTLLAMVQGWTDEPDPTIDLNHVARVVVEAMRAAGADRLRGAPTAGLLLMSPDRLAPSSVRRLAPLAEWLDAATVEAEGLRSTIRRSRHPVARLRAWQWLGRDHLSPACVDRLARSFDPADHESVLSSVHLGANPRRARWARGIARAAGLSAPKARVAGGEVAAAAPSSILPRGPLPLPEDVPALSPRAKWGLAAWVGLIGAPAPIRRAVLDPLLTDPSPGVRLSAARVATSDDLADYCFDEDAAVARTAMTRWSLLGVHARAASPGASRNPAERTARLRLLRKLERSPHAAVRAMAACDLGLADPLAAPREIAAPIPVAGTMEAMVAPPPPEAAWASPHETMWTLRRIQSARLTVDMQNSIAQIMIARTRMREQSASPEHARLAATVVSALADILPHDRSTECREVLANALRDADDRVRANAVDGIARDARRHPEQVQPGNILLEFKGDAHHRVRASALRGLLWLSDLAGHGSTPAVGERAAAVSPSDMVMEMLSDARGPHRLAGVWLSERRALSGGATRHELAMTSRRLRELAEHESDPRLVARASRAVRRIRMLTTAVPGLADESGVDDAGEETA